MDQFFRTRSVLITSSFFLFFFHSSAAERPISQGLAGTLALPNYFPPPDSFGGWRTATNAAQVREAAAMDLTRLEQAWEFTQRCTQNAGLLVVRNGWLVFEKYVGRASRNANPDMASTGKAYTSIACGIMLQEFRDKIPDGLDTRVFTSKFLPEGSMRVLARSDSAPSPVSGDADKSTSVGIGNASELPARAREAARGARTVPEQNTGADAKFEFDDSRRADITLGQLLCMTGGYNGEGGSPTAVVMGKAFPLKASPGQNIKDIDGSSLRCAMWTNAGAGYSYSSPEPHIASMVLRRVTGMELDKYIDERLAKPMGWGAWGYCLNRGGFRMPHANGAGSIAVHATDALRFGYCLLRGGKWGDKQLVPADYIALCNKMSPHNPHSPYTLMFEQNSDGHVAGTPRDAFWKSGAGGFALIIVPSLDLVIYKMGGNNGQYDPTLTDVPQPEPSHERDDWKPISGTPFVEGSRAGDDGIRRVLEMVCAAVRMH
jgi:CubicO group peptidase (beta-lactamase class C family)